MTSIPQIGPNGKYRSLGLDGGSCSDTLHWCRGGTALSVGAFGGSVQLLYVNTVPCLGWYW